MPFQRELDSILRDVRGAQGAILVDFEGEAVVSAHAGISHYDLKVVGAYGGIFFERLRRITRDLSLGTPMQMTIDGSDTRLLVCGLKDGYHLLLAVEKGAPVAYARERLRIAAERLIDEL